MNDYPQCSFFVVELAMQRIVMDRAMCNDNTKLVHVQFPEGTFHAKDFRIIFRFSRTFGFIGSELTLSFQPVFLFIDQAQSVVYTRKIQSYTLLEI